MGQIKMYYKFITKKRGREMNKIIMSLLNINYGEVLMFGFIPVMLIVSIFG